MAHNEVRTALRILLASAALAACGGSAPPQSPAGVTTTTGGAIDYSPSEPTLTSMSRVPPASAPVDAGAVTDELPTP